jgi:hypothetical protein
VPTADDFRALARSSPWRWSTLRFTVRWPGDPYRTDALRAWLRRPDVARVETVEGELRQIVRERGTQVGVLTSDGGRTSRLPWPGEGPRPELRPDGLVAARPSSWDVSYDAPMYQDYRWVAMLDPVELADGRFEESGDRAGPGPDIAEVREVEHGGRPAWEARVTTTAGYEPRCGCCPLLRSREVDEAEWGAPLLEAYPASYRVRLDVRTGVCVLTEATDDRSPGHDLRIEAVDEPMDDGLFVGPRRRGLLRRGWQPFA